ncbi:hypothetical protein GGD52_003299 [Agrobacterium tumefaciens]|nr:hypothetical protein [Agrobacterium radiobacter]MBB5588695.1 hypothetical protein [Agrobacterium radiobacter]
MLPLQAISHDAFAAAQMRKARPDLKLLDPLTNKDAISTVCFFALVECDTVEQITG